MQHGKSQGLRQAIVSIDKAAPLLADEDAHNNLERLKA